MPQPDWLRAAWAEFAVREVAGSTDNPRIVKLFADAGFPRVLDDETAWCAAFVGACLTRGGIAPSRSLMARSYSTWGARRDETEIGAIAVFSRTSDPALGHVGFVAGFANDTLFVLGGNQSDAVSVAAFPRSRLVALRWPSEIETPQPPPPQDLNDGALFARALAHVLEMEGGFSNDPYDAGGPTNRGITLKVYADWTGATLDAASHARLKRELQSISIETVQSIYRARYWHPASCAELSAPLALMHFDAAVNHGVGTAIRFLQTALGVEADGDIGPLTRAALAGADVTATLEAYAELRRRRYRALPHFWRFGRGWLRRVEATRTAALMRAAALQTSAPKPQSKGLSTMTQPNDLVPPAATAGKWWGHSLTIWGAAVTAAAALLPALGPLIGLDITPDAVRKLGGDLGTLVQLVTGLLGTVMTIYGRSRAAGPLVRRDMFLRL